jgi:hypothetical protein
LCFSAPKFSSIRFSAISQACGFACQEEERIEEVNKKRKKYQSKNLRNSWKNWIHERQTEGREREMEGAACVYMHGRGRTLASYI